MIARVTSQTLMDSAQRNLQMNQARLAELQNKATSQNAIGRPSDDPAGTAESMRVHAQQRANEQYGRNITDGNGWFTTIDSAMATTTDLMNSMRDLAVLGGNDSLSPSGRSGIIAELESVKDGLMRQANSTYMGRSVFAGTSDAGQVFTSKPDPDAASSDAKIYTYTGNPDGTVERRIGQDTTVRVDADGGAIFGSAPESTSAFALIDNMISALKADENTSSFIDAVDDRITTIVSEHAKIGTRHAQLQRAEEANLDESISLEAHRSGLEDIDMGQIILELKTQELAYQSALAVTARVLQPTLMDFLR